jgi:hypothetical protein
MLMEKYRLTLSEMDDLAHRMETKARELSGIAKRAGETLSAITNYTSFVITPATVRLRLKSIKLIVVQEGLVLAVLVATGDVIKDTRIKAPIELNQEFADRLSGMITELLSMKTYDEMDFNAAVFREISRFWPNLTPSLKDFISSALSGNDGVLYEFDGGRVSKELSLDEGTYYFTVKNFDKDNFTSMIYKLKISSDKGFTKAEYSLGCLYYERGSTHMYMRSLVSDEESRKSTEAEGKKYYAMAFSYLKRASDKGHLEAQFWLAECYRCGFGTKRDAAAALPLYKKVALAEGDFASSAKRELFSILCKDNNYAKAEEISIKHKWFNELTEEYLFSIRSNDKAGYNRVITWLNKAQAAGYADAAEKMAEAEMRFSDSRFPFSINFPE